MDLADHYVREQVERGTITVTFLATSEMIADIMTKALGETLFSKFATAIVGCTSKGDLARTQGEVLAHYMVHCEREHSI